MAGGVTVNGGIGGATAPVYAAELDRLVFPGRAGLAVLFIGSNDIAAIHRPLSARSVARFARGAEATLVALGDRARTVWVAAIPPIRPTSAYPQVVEAIPVYNTVLATIAAARGCPFIDPFAGLRDGEGGWAKPGAMADGTHLADYRPIAETLAALGRAATSAEVTGAGSAESGLHPPTSPAIAPAHRHRTAAGPGA
jgi:hypothetical protein